MLSCLQNRATLKLSRIGTLVGFEEALSESEKAPNDQNPALKPYHPKMW